MSQPHEACCVAQGSERLPACSCVLWPQVTAAARTQDNNWGLIKLCLDAKAKRSIQRLTQTFLTLSLADMAHQGGVAGPGQAEEVILRWAPGVLTTAWEVFPT